MVQLRNEKKISTSGKKYMKTLLLIEAEKLIAHVF